MKQINKTLINYSRTLLFFSTITISLISCSKPKKNKDVNSVDSVNSTNAIRLTTNAQFGSILTDKAGKTLYFFSLDHFGTTSSCGGQCTTNWPTFYSENPTFDSGLSSSDFGTITRADGNKQTTYKGWPLYTFAGDAAAGQTNGEAINNVWFVAKPDYSIMYVNAQLIGRSSGGVEDSLNSSFDPGTGNTFYITDARGRTLYSFINDKKNTNNWNTPTNTNAGVWPIASIAVGKVPSILNTSDFGTILVGSVAQLTYKGWPLYYFNQDLKRGDNFGVGFPMPKVWPTLNANSPIAPL
jgi:predicted lipoprotein with Yx(FWY)xxD motif